MLAGTIENAMARTYDLVAIGSGSAATTAAMRVAAAGWSVAVVDHRPLGGTCALRGCDPKKMMVSAEEAVDWSRRMTGRGVRGELRIDWSELIAFKRSFTDPIPEKRRTQFERAGIGTFEGLARFTAPDRLEVGRSELRFRYALIATGARPVPLSIQAEDLVSTSDDFLELEELPARIAFIGGGYIAAEFSQLAARAGAEVTVLHRGPRLLKKFDPDLVDLLGARFGELGIVVETC